MDEDIDILTRPAAASVVCAGHDPDCACPDCADAFTWVAFEQAVATETERLHAAEAQESSPPPSVTASTSLAPTAAQSSDVANAPHTAARLDALRRNLTAMVEVVDSDGADDQGLLDATAAALRVEAAAHAVALAYLARAHRRQATQSRHGIRTGSWIDGALHALDRGPANALVKTASRLHDRFPTTARALAEGRLSPAQAEAAVRALVHLPDDLSGEAVAIAESYLLDEATYSSPADLRRRGNTLAVRVDPEGEDVRLRQSLERADREVDAGRTLTFWEDSVTGGTGFKGVLPPVEGRLFQDLVEAIAHRPRPGEEGQDAGDERSAPQKRADALAEILHVYKGTDLTVCRGGSRPRVNVLVPADALTGTGVANGTLFDGEDVGEALTRSLACDAVLSLIGVDRRGIPVVAGSTGRFFADDVRQALTVRDHGCAFPGCSAPPAACDGHHILPWARNGPTTVENGVLLCPFHHRLVEPHASAPPGSRWEIRLDRGGLPEVLPPTWVDAHRRPRQHHRYHTLYRP